MHIKDQSLFAGDWYVAVLLMPHCCTFLSAHFSPGYYLWFTYSLMLYLMATVWWVVKD